ncbi:MaoC/PaaZ C-terminal domain-containing protein [Lentisphaera profundi]|uniref:MaoC/PaaZ C-terminal domain-containing protein n=1 Tax=Lentisphaera profundi TaxID=1658616 RepID=A0ABY7VVQ9_9BACT|nr:MaoC/PaaZ C-terminal domain-containing protein [Lentisphaera profundi]WDE97373.1 MaoC/PaaZ C-terminal domain-containing protein [Lentisphaera profundi]
MIHYTEKPSILKSSLSLLRHRPKFQPHAQLPEIDLRWSLPCIDLLELNHYQKLCGYTIGAQVPLCFPYVLCGPLHLQLLTRLPIPAMGLLHLRSQIHLKAAIDSSSPCQLICRSGNSQLTPQGLEFEAISILEQGGQVRWSCTATFLRRASFPEAEDSPAPVLSKLDYRDPIASFAIPRNIGRRYARLCGDFNPIHISSPSAWLFGLKGSIAHGMWVTARALALILQQVDSLELSFKGPVFTGGQVDLMQNDSDFNLFYRGNPRPVILAKMN